MAEVLGQLFRPQKKALNDLKALELQTAKEILAEVFRVRISVVDEMIPGVQSTIQFNTVILVTS